MNNAMEIEESFADMLEKSIKTLNTGDKVTGVVTGITATEVNVDLGTKHAGYIPMSELSDDPAVKPEDIVKVGDEVAAGETLCIVEAMKLMNEIAAEEMGTVREVCLSDATPVEYGTVLFYVEPHDPTPGA